MDDRELTKEQRTQRMVYAAVVALVALGLACSMALLVDYLRPMPLFCSDTGGCAELRRSAYAHMLFGLPTPAVGVAGYGVLALLTVIPGQTSRFLQLVASMFGALVAAYFLFLQFSLSTFCAYCMTVDITSVVLLSVVLMRVRTEADGDSWRAMAGAAGVIAAAAAIPLLSHVLVKTRVPDVIAAEMKKSAPGQVTVVDFVDFECPYCRQTAVDFEPTLVKYKGKFRLVRKQTPLKMHSHAMGAARAACCAESMGRGDAMATALFTAPVDQLTDDGCTLIASGLGIQEAAFRACLADPATQQKIDADAAEFKAAQGHALPTIWINDQVIEGAQGPDKLREAMEHAIEQVGG